MSERVRLALCGPVEAGTRDGCTVVADGCTDGGGWLHCGGDEGADALYVMMEIRWLWCV